MPDRIRLLPDSVANQIAAGEVIQRPASVIKELVENAVDAGADDIRIFVKDAGRTLIQVIDNGIGMSETDARMAFERHATSKISSAEDLSQLRTMGFRGEALPSICAISMVEVKTRQKGAPIGTHLVINGSKVESQTPDVCEEGTSIMVKNIFFNVPARRKFMKSDSVELSNIIKEFEKLALVNPGVKMSLDTGAKTIELRKGTFLQRIADLWKGNLQNQLIPVEADTPTVKISGFVSRPEFARRRNPLQFLLVNGRNMRHPYFRKAILNCFNGLIAPDTMPNFFIKFEVDPAAIDVNIHPTKDEIKFEEEAVIWSVLSAAVKGSLGKHAAVPSIDFESETLPVDGGQRNGSESSGIDLEFNPFSSAVKNAPTHQRPAEKPDRDPNWEKLYDGFLNRRPIETQHTAPQPVISGMERPGEAAQEVGSLQINQKYIFTPAEKDGVIVIDQYRAHLKIIYEQLLQRLKNQIFASQSLLFPEYIEVDSAQEPILDRVNPVLRDLGLIIEREGANYVVTGTPPGVTAQGATEIVERLIDSAADGTAGFEEETTENAVHELKRKVILEMARSMAVKRGRTLTEEERRELVSDLFALPDPSLSPDGCKIFTILSDSDLSALL
ncbi:MAG: DNA mismatch repair endonuclease MutL [Muribaculaceae bacterium]|nr:DNA mismatch repair endonuclease MutL [Muribaculaceae bacterium]